MIICGIISVFTVSTIILSFIFGYNLYIRNKRNIYNMIIDDKEENINAFSKIGLEYKIKFLLYSLILIIELKILFFIY